MRGLHSVDVVALDEVAQGQQFFRRDAKRPVRLKHRAKHLSRRNSIQPMLGEQLRALGLNRRPVPRCRVFAFGGALTVVGSQLGGRRAELGLHRWDRRQHEIPHGQLQGNLCHLILPGHDPNRAAILPRYGVARRIKIHPETMGLGGRQVEGNRFEPRIAQLLTRHWMFKGDQRVRIPVRFEIRVPIGAVVQKELVLAVEAHLNATGLVAAGSA